MHITNNWTQPMQVVHIQRISVPLFSLKCKSLPLLLISDLLEYSLDNKLAALRKSADEFSANIQHEPLHPEENKFLPFVGNGLIGVVIKQDSVVNLQRERVLQLPVMYHPLVWTEFELMSKSAKALDYVDGIAHTVTCYMNDICITSQYYAHRTLPSIFVQEIEVVNPASYNAKVYLSRQVFHNSKWPGCEVGSLRLVFGYQEEI